MAIGPEHGLFPTPVARTAAAPCPLAIALTGSGNLRKAPIFRIVRKEGVTDIAMRLTFIGAAFKFETFSQVMQQREAQMLSAHEFATLLLIRNAPELTDLDRGELQTLLEQQLIALEQTVNGIAMPALTPVGLSLLRAMASLRPTDGAQLADAR
ncbi:hypothetical protein ACFFIG_10275 [Paraburkholderia rhizosphaerae]